MASTVKLEQSFVMPEACNMSKLPQTDLGRSAEPAQPTTRHALKLSLSPELPRPNHFASSDVGESLSGSQLLEPLQQQEAELPAMAPPPRRDLLAKEHFAVVFGGAKTQSYQDPAAKGPGTHT